MDDLRKPSLSQLDKIDLRSPIALDPKNFTSLRRTPWAGTDLAQGIKSRQCSAPSQRIGESWEMSCDPDAQSRLAAHPTITLADLISKFPEECLSRELTTSGRTTCDILIKLLNADSPLSLQIHPSDDHPALKSSECGKPESWLVISAKEGSGFYLGFSRSMTIDEIREKLQSGTFTSDLLQFVPVKTGDYFEIEPHVPHAIGPGVILLEPQRIIAGKSGKTWRMWDWNRRYNESGELDNTNGTPRELHINESMSLLNPPTQVGFEYVQQLRRKPETLNIDEGVTVNAYPANNWYQTIFISMNANTVIRLNDKIAYGCLTMISGVLKAKSSGLSKTQMNQGESFFLPATCLPLELACDAADTQFTLVIPSGKGTAQLNRDRIANIFL